MLLRDDVVADRQAEPRPFAGWLGREERLEQLVPDLGRDAGPVVADADLDGIAEIARGDLERGAIVAAGAGRLALPGGIEGIDREIVFAMGTLMASWPCGIALGLIAQGQIAETFRLARRNGGDGPLLPGLARAPSGLLSPAAWRSRDIRAAHLVESADRTFAARRPRRQHRLELLQPRPDRLLQLRTGTARQPRDVRPGSRHRHEPASVDRDPLNAPREATCRSDCDAGRPVRGRPRPRLVEGLSYLMPRRRWSPLRGASPILACIAFGLAIGAGPGAIMALPARVLAPAHRATSIGIFGSLYAAIQGVGPWLAGILAEITGSPAAPLVLAAALFAACLPLTALFEEARAASRRAT